jgi:predicted N-acetyltransferase YhbS
MENANKHLGEGKVEETWYLKTLAVSPKFQRKGVGTALVKWGMERARLNGERLYVDASYVGKPLYLKLGFNEVGGFLVGDSGVRVTNMLWDSK